MLSPTLAEKLRTSSAARSAIMSVGGLVDITAWPGVTLGKGLTTGQRIANGAALLAADQYAASNGLMLGHPGHANGFEHISQQMGGDGVNAGRTTGAVRTGFHILSRGIVGRGIGQSRFANFATNYPAVTWGAVTTSNSDSLYDGKFIDCGFGHGVDQTGQTDGVCIRLGRMWSTDIRADATPFAADDIQAESYKGWEHADVANNFFFACRIPFLNVRTGIERVFHFEPKSSTGSVWGVMYFGGGSPSDYFVTNGGPILIKNASFGSVALMKPEWLTCSAYSSILALDNVRSFNAEQIRFEGGRMVGDDGALVLASNTNMEVGQFIGLDNEYKSGTATGTPAIIKSDYSSDIHIGSGELKWNSGGAGLFGVATVSPMLHRHLPSINDGRRSNVEIGNMEVLGNASPLNIDATLLASQIGNVTRFGKYIHDRVQSRLDRAEILAPSGVGNIVVRGSLSRPMIKIDTAVPTDRKVIWSDVQNSAAPGSSLPTDANDTLEVVRTGAATGAGAVNVRDSGDANTIVPVTAASTAKRVTRAGTTLTGF